MICYYAIINFNYRFKMNYKQRIVERCNATGYPFYICVRGRKNTPVKWVKDFRGEHKHNVGEMCQMSVWTRRRVIAELLRNLIESKVRLCLD